MKCGMKQSFESVSKGKIVRTISYDELKVKKDFYSRVLKESIKVTKLIPRLTHLNEIN